jgi:tape measure domain-containing protein
MVERLGIAAGGEREAFDNLTRAMAQVNAAGKLMGQEKNQLINAGFSLKIIADEAGVSMTNFSKAMEEGAISAKHVNDALIKATSEGGLYFGRLEKKSKTLNGQLDLLTNNFNDLFANLGESGEGGFSVLLKSLNEVLSEASSVISQANELEKSRQETLRLRKLLEPSEQQQEGTGRGISSSFLPGSVGTNEFTRAFSEGMGAYFDPDVPWYMSSLVSLKRFWSELVKSEQEAYLESQQELQQQREEQARIEAKLEKKGIELPSPVAGTGGDPNVLTGTTAENLAEAAKQAAGLPGNLGPGTIDEYNFIRDKMMEDRNLAMKSLAEQKEQTRQLQIMNGEKAGHRTNRRHHPSRQALRTRLGMDPQSMMPMPFPITGYEPLGEGGVPASQYGMSATEQVKSDYRKRQREIYDKWKMTDAVQTSEGSYGTTLSESERRGYEEEAGELRRQYKKDLAKAKEQDETTKDWAEFMASSFKETIKEQTRELTGGEDKQLQGVD